MGARRPARAYARLARSIPSVSSRHQHTTRASRLAMPCRAGMFGLKAQERVFYTKAKAASWYEESRNTQQA